MESAKSEMEKQFKQMLKQEYIMAAQKPPLKTMNNIHHAAYGCRDAEQTRWFYEDILGLELAAAFYADRAPGSDEKTPFMHLFFKMGDGNYIAFFDAPEITEKEWLEKKHSFVMHIAFEVDDEAAMLAWQKEINAKGKSCLGPVDHGFVKSVYMYDPNGIQVEITCKTARYDELMTLEQQASRNNILEWDKMKRAFKEEKFGAQELDRRGNK